MLTALSRRLEAAAGCVPPGCRAADIGCDHGKLSAYLATDLGCTVTAADLREGPLQKARELFAALGIEDRVQAVLSDGFEAVEPPFDAAVIAGIGADNIIGIIDRCEYLKSGVRLVLVPASRHGLLRRYLCQSGFVIEKEIPICEAGHCYTVMQASYGGSPRSIDGGFAAVGPIAADSSADGRQYIKNALAGAERALDGIGASQSPDECHQAELIKTINYLRSLL